MHYLLIKIQLLWAKHTKWLDRNPVKVPVSKRVIAYAIDWAVGGIISGFPAVLFYGGVTGRSDMFSDLYVFPSLGFPTYWSYLAGILCIVVAFVYYIYIPYKKYPGQTLAKHWLKIKIVNNDDYSDVSLKTLIIRQGVGLFLLEGSAIVVTNYLRQMLTLATGFYFDYYLKMIGMVITMISGVFVLGSASQRSIHDYLAKTRVVGEDEKPAKRKEKKNKKNKKKSIMDILILLPMFVPPSAIGYIILITLGKNSFIGVILEKYFNIRIIFTIQACIIASVIVTLPLMYQSIKTSIFAIDQDIINASKLDGASDFKIFTKIILPLCKNGIYSGILLSFARSLGEFGATILVAGNIPGKTQTLPMAMYNAIEANQTKTTIIILFVILSISILLIIIYHNLNKDKI